MTAVDVISMTEYPMISMAKNKRQRMTVEITAFVNCLPMVVEKKNVYSRPITGFAMVNRMQRSGLKSPISNAAPNTIRRTMGA